MMGQENQKVLLSFPIAGFIKPRSVKRSSKDIVESPASKGEALYSPAFCFSLIPGIGGAV